MKMEKNFFDEKKKQFQTPNKKLNYKKKNLINTTKNRRN